ncbi:biosynthetic-type acetolactate synthase large subunit [bacterium]|nr:MAG: biosynthetic-type acetolactate synthase large subunit [bacterium]
METTGSRLLLSALKAHGIDTVFGYPGGAIMPLYDVIPQSGLTHYLVRHEQGAVFAAGAYARTTGRLGVCVSTSGPGATNMVTGLLDAMMDSAPVLAITGQVRSALMGTDGFQEADVVGITSPCTKHNALVSRAADIPAAIERAIRIATSGRPGPVLVDVTTDALKERLTWDAPLRQEAERPRAFQDVPSADLNVQATEAIAALARAERPVIIVGGGTRIANVIQEFRRFAALIGAPVVATLNGLGTAEPGDPHYLGMFGMHGHKGANLAVTRADCMLALGMRFDDRVTGDVGKFGRNATIIHCDIDPTEIGKIIPVDIPVVGDLRETIAVLTQVAEVATMPSYEPWLTEVATLRRPLPPARHENDELSATDVLDALAAMMEPGTVVATDVGQHQMWMAQRVRLESSRDFLTSAGLGAMGFGLPAAVGAQVARPKDPVVAVVGDGGFQMTMHELATIRRYELPVKIVVIDNRHLGMVRQWQELFYDRRIVATDLYDNPEFCTLASAYGIRSARVERAEDLHRALREMLESDGAFLLHCACFPTENCFPMVPAGRHIDEMLERTPA